MINSKFSGHLESEMPRIGKSSAALKRNNSNEVQSRTLVNETTDGLRDTLKKTSSSMMAVAKRLADEEFYNLDFEQETISKWMRDLDGAALQLARTEKRRKVVDEQIATLRQNPPQNMDTKAVMSKLNEMVDAHLASFNPMSAVEYIDVLKELKKIKQAYPADDDIEMVNTGLTEHDFICQFTRQPMIRPFRNKKCGHYLSEEAIKAMTARTRKATCVVPGCDAFWDGKNHELDEARAVAAMKFFRKKTEKEMEKENSGVSSAHDLTQSYTEV